MSAVTTMSALRSTITGSMFSSATALPVRTYTPSTVSAPATSARHYLPGEETVTPAQQDCLTFCDDEGWEQGNWAICMLQCYNNMSVDDDGDDEVVSRRDASYATSSPPSYVASGPSTITITETWVHHDTICSAAPVCVTTSCESTPASHALSTSRSVVASYATNTSSHPVQPYPVYPTQPVYRSTFSKSTPVYPVSTSKSTPATYAVSTSKNTPVYPVSTSESTPVGAVSPSKSTPVYPVLTSKNTPVYAISTAESSMSKPHPVYPTSHYSQPTHYTSPNQSSITGHSPAAPKTSNDYSSETHPASNTSDGYNAPEPTEPIVSLGSASAYGFSMGAVAIALAAML